MIKLRNILKCSTVLVAATSVSALAQEIPETEQTAASAGDELIVVTGSRIERRAEESSIPLQVFGTEDFDDIGTTDLAEAITELPGVGDGISIQGSNNSVQTSGLSTISLRRLGDDRTLVLINGKRAVSNSGNSDRVSLSTLPVGFVKRTEITTGGASAIYGSDAIAGVANFILEDSFEGIEFDGRYSTPDASGGEEYRLSGRVGQRFADDRGYILFGASYRNENEIRADATRPLSILALEFDDPASPTGNDSFSNEINRPGCDPTNEDRFCLVPSLEGSLPGGVFEGDAWFKNGRWFNDQSLRPTRADGSFDREVGQDFYNDFDGFNERIGRVLNASREILNLGLTANYEITPDIKLNLVALFSNVKSETNAGSQEVTNNSTFGFLASDTVGTISASNPFIPPEVEETRSGSVSFDRTFVEVGEQSRENDRDTYRLMADVDGQLTDDIKWNIFGTFGRFEQTQVNDNEVNLRNLRFGLDVETVNGVIQCTDADARTAGCVPVNLFGEGSISSEAADYIRYNGFGTQVREQITAGGSFAGDLFDLGSSTIKFAAGVEYRRESQNTVGDPDGDLVGGLDGDPTTDDIDSTTLATFPSISANFDVIEAFAELDIPIVEDMLNLQLAGRIGEYSTVGTITSYNAGIVFQPVEDIRFRAQYSRSQRAPNLTEFFSPARADSDGLADPCDGLLPDGTGIDAPESVGGDAVNLATVSANCLAVPGIQAFFDEIANDGDPSNDGDPFEFDSSVQGPNSGNPNVKEETATTYTAGIVLTPRWIDNFSIVADYYRIEIKDAITSISTQNTVDLCFAADDFPANKFCDVITRSPSNGEVVQVINFQENLDREIVEGLDVSVNWDRIKLPANFPGTFDLNFVYSHYFTDETSFVGLGNNILTNNFLGEIGGSKDEFRFRAGYRNGGLRLAYIINYESGGIDDLVNNPTPEDDGFFRAKGLWRHNISARYSFGPDQRFRLTAGVRNLFNEFGAFIPTGLPGGSGSQQNIVEAINDTVGREFFLGASVRF